MMPYELNARHQLDRIGNFGSEKCPGWLLDRLAEEKLSGGYLPKRNPVCPECRLQKANSGVCGC
jgi:hypothetical protein